MNTKIITTYCLTLIALLCIGVTQVYAVSEVTGTLSAGAGGSGTSGTIGGTVGGGGSSGGGSSGGGSSSGGSSSGGSVGSSGQVLGASTGPGEPGLPSAGFPPQSDEKANSSMPVVSIITASSLVAYMALRKKSIV